MKKIDFTSIRLAIVMVMGCIALNIGCFIIYSNDYFPSWQRYAMFFMSVWATIEIIRAIIMLLGND